MSNRLRQRTVEVVGGALLAAGAGLAVGAVGSPIAWGQTPVEVQTPPVPQKTIDTQPQPAGAATAQPGKLPAQAKMLDVTRRYFQSLKDYRPGDLLTRNQVAPLFDQLQKAGWKVSDRDDILGIIVADGDVLAKYLRGERGVEFMRKISSEPGAFDRLHRLTQTANGANQIRDLVKLPNGPQVLKALTSSRAGKDIARRIARGPETSDFDKDTGMIYTEEPFVQRLLESYQRDADKAAKAAPSSGAKPAA